MLPDLSPIVPYAALFAGVLVLLCLVFAFVLLRGFMRPSPVAFGIPPQSGESVSELAGRIGGSERSTEII